jgi:short-subunit dehydrogenase
MVAVPGQVVYAGTKFAVVGLSTALADEFAPHGVEVSVVMPPFTNTELISGTSGVAANRPVEPEAIAAAIVKVLDKPKTHVSVPGGLRFILAVTNMLGPRGRRWLNRRTGTDRVFLDFDADVRRSYEERAQAATGVVGNEDDWSTR